MRCTSYCPACDVIEIELVPKQDSGWLVFIFVLQNLSNKACYQIAIISRIEKYIAIPFLYPHDFFCEQIDFAFVNIAIGNSLKSEKVY